MRPIFRLLFELLLLVIFGFLFLRLEELMEIISLRQPLNGYYIGAFFKTPLITFFV